MIEIVPAIDIMDGRCVRLSKGDFAMKKIYDSSPIDMARRFEDCGVKRIHLVDLDGAKNSAPSNLPTLEAVASAVGCKIEWGGGICDSSALSSAFSAGADFIVVGSKAVSEPDLFALWLQKYPGKMILGADIKEGKIAVKGWIESVSLSIRELCSRFSALGLKEMICTDISRDGMLQGPDSQFYVEIGRMIEGLGISLTASGGVSSMADIRLLDSLSLGKVVVGKAIYEGRITLKEIEEWSQNA